MGIEGRDMVYMVRESDGCMYIGAFSPGSDRLKTHENNGSELLWIRPGSGKGTGTDERRLHRFFNPLLARRGGSQSAFRDDGSMSRYADWLLDMGYAASSHADALRLNDLPFHVWTPERCGDGTTDGNGQFTFPISYPAATRKPFTSPYIHLQSESDEWLSPPSLIEPVREALDGIDCDPASNIQAQQWIRATVWYSKQVSGLSHTHPWAGHVWLNPPYGRGDNRAEKFIERLIRELDAGTVTRAITCLNLFSMSSIWFDALWDHASLHLIWRDRIVFLNGDEEIDKGKDSSKGTVLSYFGDEIGAQRFSKTFKDKGHLVRLV